MRETKKTSAGALRGKETGKGKNRTKTDTGNQKEK